jgi:hypothetical protein
VQIEEQQAIEEDGNENSNNDDDAQNDENDVKTESLQHSMFNTVIIIISSKYLYFN